MPPTICILSGYLTGSYEGPLVAALMRVVSRAGGRVIAVQTAGSGSDYHQGIILKDLAHVGWDQVSGFITIANAAPRPYLQALREAGKPVIAISNEERDLSCPVVLPDNVGGARQAVEHLLGHGHSRIGFVGCLGQFDIRERYEAYRSTLLEHDILPDPGLVYEADNNFEHGAARAVRALLAARMPSTALFAATDLNAVGIMRGLKDAGYTLPQDQAIVGFDDKPDCALLSPSLSTVSQDLDCMGTLAAELMLEHLSGAPVASGRYLVPTSYVARESCGCGGMEGRRAATGASVTGDPVAAFLSATGAGDPLERARRGAPAASLASELREIYQQVVAEEPTARQLLRVSQICEELYAQGPGPATYNAILALAHELRAEVGPTGADLPAGFGERLGHCTSQVRLSLTKALLDVRNTAYYELRKTLRDEYEITLHLLNDQDEDPRLLEWLRNTDAVVGVLALWREAGPPAREQTNGEAASGPPLLDVAGTFDASGRAFEFSGRALSVEAFPPEELFGADHEQRLVCVFPVKSAARDWGFLAIAQPPGAHLEQEAFFTWSALFSQALDHKALLASLSQRGEDLARSYRRERQMAQAVRESEERYALAAQAANDGLWDWDLTKGTVYYSPRWAEMLGFHPGALADTPEEWLDRVHPEDLRGLREQLAALRTGERGSVLNEHRVRGHDEEYLWVLCRGLAVPGLGAPATRVVGSLTDVTERRALEERLRQQALYDGLTGLANRVLFLDRLSQVLANAKRHLRCPFAVLWLDLDGFKHLNDTFGHLSGDKLLVQVGERIRSHIREVDTAARFGGDEFVVLLRDADQLAVESVVNRLSCHLNEPYDLDGKLATVTASIGVALSSPSYERAEEVLRDADIAMYRAKSRTWGPHVIFEASMGEGAARG
jgi:diguanylate cyclase (GGDEF)-like protein